MPTVVNGQIGSWGLASIGSGQALRPDAATAWLAVVAEMLTRYGITLRLTDSYRPYAVQVRIFNERYDPAFTGNGPFGDVRWWDGVRYVRMCGASAAVPGTSNHGLGIAVDVTGLGGFDGTTYAYVAAIAPACGWTNTAGRQIGEAWHWEYDPTTDTHSTPAQEEDMPLNAADATLINTVVINVFRSKEARAIIRDAVLGGAVSADTGTLAQTVRDTRRIARRHELADHPDS